MFEKKMETEAIPERLFALCQLLLDGSKQEEYLRKMVEPSSLNEGKTSYFKKVCDAAVQLGLINVNDDTREVSLLVDGNIVESHYTFKKYIVQNIEKISLSQFYRTTKLYMENSQHLFFIDKDLQNVAKLVEPLNDMYREEFGKSASLSLNEENMRAWRFWASYLGFGYLHDMFFLPNTAMYIKYCIDNSKIKKNKAYTISEFIGLLHPYIDICVNTKNETDRYLNFAVSNGFRTLHDLGILQLKYVNDRKDEWNLTTMELHEFSSLVTDCIYKGD